MRAYRATGTPYAVYVRPSASARRTAAGRTIWVGPYDRLLRGHWEWMTTPEAWTLHKRRKELSGPVFGIPRSK